MTQTTSMNNPAASAKADYHRRRREHQRLNVPLFVAALEGIKTPEQILLEREQAERLDRLIDQLKPPRAGLAVRYYYGIRCEPGTLEQVANKFGVTRERVRQILHKALRTLRHRMLKADDRKRYLENLDREIAERRDNERRLEALLRKEREKNLADHRAWEEQQEQQFLQQTDEERALRAEQFRQMLAEHEAKQRVQDKRRAEQEFDLAYTEAHRLNALWELELERRADEMRHKLNMAERRLRDERAEAERLNELWEARLKRRASRHKGKRDWLLVGSK